VLAPATPPRKTAAVDSVTTNLAHRLNELAVANAEGLLNDDEYRLLRQSLFDRFASSSVVPQESPTVPASAPRQARDSSDGRPRSRATSNFQVELPRPSSRASSAFGTGVTDLLKRATRRQSSSHTVKDGDTSSVWSGKSGTSNLFRFASLSKKSSASSLHTTGSDVGSPQSSRTRSRAGSTTRGKAAPPSAYPTRVIGQDATYSPRGIRSDDELQTSHDIQGEIKAVEAEQRRLMDAFNGLELTTLSKARRHARPSPVFVDEMGSYWTGQSDARSIRSNTSAGTSPSVAPSMARSGYSGRSRPVLGKGLQPAAASLHRKNSSSSVTSADRRGQALPPMPALPVLLAHGRLRAANSSTNASQVSLARSTATIPMDVVHEDEERSESRATIQPEDGLEEDMDDIRRRREEVSARYEARLDYLRAKLKGAQLHEKLMKK